MPQRSKDVLTVEQMAAVLGIGRQSAYAQCRLYLASGGTDGVPCHRIGRLIRIYRAELEGWLGFPIELPTTVDPPVASTPVVTRSAPAPAADPRPRAKRRPRRVVVGQATLPF